MTELGRDALRPVRIPFDGITLDQRGAVMGYLHEHDVYHQFVDDDLVVPAKHVEQIHGLIDRFAPRNGWYEGSGLAAADGRPIPGLGRWRGARGPESDDPDSSLVFTAAPLWTRPARYVVDVCTIAVVCLVLALAVASETEPSALAAALIGLVGWFAALIVPNALWGRTVGAKVTGTRLVGFETLDRPGWGRSIVRSFVPMLPTFVANVLFTFDLGERADIWIGSAAFVAGLGVYASLLADPDRRGWHDRLSRTIVVDHRPRVVPGSR